MGMYDDVILLDDSLSMKCRAGHKLEHFQTKSLGKQLGMYLIRDKQLLCKKMGWQSEALKDGEETPLKSTVTISMLTCCLDCKTINARAKGGDINQHHPWTTVELEVENGLVTSCAYLERQSRDELLAELKADGHKIIDQES